MRKETLEMSSLDRHACASTCRYAVRQVWKKFFIPTPQHWMIYMSIDGKVVSAYFEDPVAGTSTGSSMHMAIFRDNLLSWQLSMVKEEKILAKKRERQVLDMLHVSLCGHAMNTFHTEMWHDSLWAVCSVWLTNNKCS